DVRANYESHSGDRHRYAGSSRLADDDDGVPDFFLPAKYEDVSEGAAGSWTDRRAVGAWAVCEPLYADDANDLRCCCDYHVYEQLEQLFVAVDRPANAAKPDGATACLHSGL